MRNFKAVGNATLTIFVVCWAVCLVVYIPQHWMYPRYRNRFQAGAGEGGGSGATAAPGNDSGQASRSDASSLVSTSSSDS